MSNEKMREALERLHGELVCLDWAVTARDDWEQIELRVKDMQQIAEQALAADPAEEAQPVVWRDQAFATLGAVRHKMHDKDVEAVQRFLRGEYQRGAEEALAAQVNQQMLEALKLARNEMIASGNWKASDYGWSKACESVDTAISAAEALNGSEHGK